MAKKSEVVIETPPETTEKTGKKGEETPPETKSEGTDWKKMLLIAVFSIGGLWLVFRRKDAEKTAPPAGESPGNPASPARTDRFSRLRQL
jgi:hypothetical protein